MPKNLRVELRDNTIFLEPEMSLDLIFNCKKSAQPRRPRGCVNRRTWERRCLDIVCHGILDDHPTDICRVLLALNALLGQLRHDTLQQNSLRLMMTNRAH
jgi:hypothetical protein